MADRDQESAAPRRLVVLFDRFGPYHVARINALTHDFTVTGLECFGESAEYAWRKVTAPSSFKRVTLFPEHSARESDGLDLKARIHAALSAARPDAVAVPGWSHPGALAALQWCLQSYTSAILMSESTRHDAPRSEAKEWMKSHIVQLFSAALVGGQAHADYLVQLGFPAARIFSGYDAVDNDYFATAAANARARAEDVRARLGLPSRYFLASARFIEKKNLPLLLEAYAQYRRAADIPPSPPRTGKGTEGKVSKPLSTDAAPWSLVLLGDGPLGPTLHAQLSSLNLHSHVHLPGFKQYDELPAYYALASAFVHASTQEPWGLVVNEAMACGLPVLVSHRCGCATELVSAGRNGFTFDPEDAPGLAALMSQLVQRDDLEAMGRESERVIRRWGPGAFASGMKAAADAACTLRPHSRSPGLLGRALLRAMMFQ